VSVLLGNGNGTFGYPTHYAAGRGSMFVTAQDFGGTGRLDLAVVNRDSYSVSVLAGNGNGTFQPAVNFLVGWGAFWGAVGDFNNDGKPDLVTANSSDNTVSVLLNNTISLSNFLVTGYPAVTTAGSGGAITVIARNSDGTIATGYQGTVSFTSSDPQADLPGAYTFQASDGGVHVFGANLKTAGTQSITVTDQASGITGTQANLLVTPAAANHFRIDPLTPIQAGMPFDVAVTALDAYGNVDVNYQGTVGFDTTDPDPTVVLPDTWTFTADDAGVHTFSGVVLVTPGDQTLLVNDLNDNTIRGALTVTI
jgi:hypothetical protein